ncbi:hypothetical protein LCGC14_1248680 [marine sediment metagenome]|uniref:Uncharacterized protein n=1 Tax=marine sediment metagenome TaxID=412755 RepID=A0A0F9NKZ3_9ZZZZ
MNTVAEIITNVIQPIFEVAGSAVTTFLRFIIGG